MKKLLVMVLILVLPSMALAKKGVIVDEYGVNLLEAEKVYTSVVLHPDNVKALLYSVNYQLPAIMPRCSEVEITDLSKKKMRFRLVETGREYTFAYHKRSTPMPFSEYLSDFFVSKCSDAKVKKLSKKDQEGVGLGRALVGMTKEGVLLAMGRPPHHVTPSLDQLEWMYWRNKFARTAVTFDSKGVVTGVR